MRYRQLTSTGDYIFGQGNLDYVKDREAVSQAIQTRLKLLLGEWWEDLEDGLPLFQTILLQRNNDDGIRTVDLLIQERVLTTPHVTGITSFRSEVKNGQYQAWVTVDTTFGQLKETAVLEVGG